MFKFGRVIIIKIVGYHVSLIPHNKYEIQWMHCLKHLISAYIGFYSFN